MPHSMWLRQDLVLSNYYEASPHLSTHVNHVRHIYCIYNQRCVAFALEIDYCLVWGKQKARTTDGISMLKVLKGKTTKCQRAVVLKPLTFTINTFAGTSSVHPFWHKKQEMIVKWSLQHKTRWRRAAINWIQQHVHAFKTGHTVCTTNYLNSPCL